MVPKVNKFEFYSCETIGADVVQLVGESQNRFTPEFLELDQILKIQKRAKLCELLTSIEFVIDSYGLINFLVEYSHEIDNIKLLKELLKEFNDLTSIEYIDQCLQFKAKYEKEINELKSNPVDFLDKHNTLEELIDFNYTFGEGIVLLDNEIRKNPDKFCFDELGKSIDPTYSGNLKHTSNKGNLMKDYNFVNGRVHGKGVDYDFYGRKERETLFENGKIVRILRSWDKEGNER